LDGHHRWATYLRLRAEQGGPGPDQDSPWNYGLVLLVDTARYPLEVRAIHRVLPRLPLKKALDLLDRAGAASGEGSAFRVRTLEAPLDEVLEELEDTPGNAFLLTEGEGVFHLLDRPSPGLLARTIDAGRPAAWRGLDATVLHSSLLDAVWRVPDRPEDISYLHHTQAAIEQAAAHGGTAVLLRAVPEATVRELAEQGVTMPRKSTSFGPKPATGLVLRTIADTPR